MIRLRVFWHFTSKLRRPSETIPTNHSFVVLFLDMLKVRDRFASGNRSSKNPTVAALGRKRDSEITVIDACDLAT